MGFSSTTAKVVRNASWWAMTRRNARRRASMSSSARIDRGPGDVIGGAVRRELMQRTRALLLVREPLIGLVRAVRRRGRLGQVRLGEPVEMPVACPARPARECRIPRAASTAEARHPGRSRSRPSTPWQSVSRAPTSAAADRDRPSLEPAPSTAATRSRNSSISCSRGISADTCRGPLDVTQRPTRLIPFCRGTSESRSAGSASIVTGAGVPRPGPHSGRLTVRFRSGTASPGRRAGRVSWLVLVLIWRPPGRRARTARAATDKLGSRTKRPGGETRDHSMSKPFAYRNAADHRMVSSPASPRRRDGEYERRSCAWPEALLDRGGEDRMRPHFEEDLESLVRQLGNGGRKPRGLPLAGPAGDAHRVLQAQEPSDVRRRDFTDSVADGPARDDPPRFPECREGDLEGELNGPIHLGLTDARGRPVGH